MASGKGKYRYIALFAAAGLFLKSIFSLLSIFEKTPITEFYYLTFKHQARCLDVLVSAFGLFLALWIWRNKGRALFQLAPIVVSFFIFLIGFEFSLNYFFADKVASSSSVWIPQKFKEQDRELDQRNKKRSLENRFGFNDINWPAKKAPGKKRIAVLGDSFLWGDGLQYEDIWTIKLRTLLQEKYPQVELFSWGKNGWSTHQQLRFLKKYGFAYDIDYLIIGFVTNDLDEGQILQRYFTWQDAQSLRGLTSLFPNSFSFISSHVNNILMKRFFSDVGYFAWQEKLYLEENLARYALTVQELKREVHKRDIPTLVVLTPNNHLDYFKRYHGRVIPLFEKHGFICFDLYPFVKKQLGEFSPWALRANPADGHPGPLVTSVFAEQVFKYLEIHELFVEKKIKL